MILLFFVFVLHQVQQMLQKAGLVMLIQQKKKKEG